MSLSKQGSPVSETRLSTTRKGITLNPNAAEFVPFSLKGPSGNTSVPDVTARFPTMGSSGKKVLDRSESSISTNSDEESRQYWQRQLPDDITPDFKVIGEDETQTLGSLSLAGLSLHGGSEANRFAAAVGSGYMSNEPLELTAHHTNDSAFGDRMRYPISVYGDDPTSTSYHQRNSKPWDMQVPSTDHHFEDGRDGTSFDESMRHSYPNDMASESSILENNDMNPVEFLASQFPGFAAESLAEVYFASGCDLTLTIEMLTQLELQVDGAFSQNTNSKTLSAPNLTSMDFPALPVPDNKTNMPKYTGNELQQTANPYGSSEKDNMLFKSSSSLTAKGATDFASAVRKLASQDSGLWKYEGNGSADATVGSSRSSHMLSGSYNTSTGRSAYIDRLQGRGSARAAPVWLETGDAVANLYSELREEARDHARIRNAYFEQARQAYLIGNKALAKELSVKGQMHNMQMKAAHNKAQESIYRQRNSITPELQGGGRSHEKMIDLHGLHVNEAIHVLRHELSVLRNASRSAEQRLLVYICVGTGHHTRGSRTPARLPISVQRYLLEEEGLEYTEPQPGLLRVVLY